MMKMNKLLFRTRDLPMAAFLVTIGHPLIACEPSGAVLIFEFPAEAANDAPAYLQGGRVPAREFYAALRDLKSLIHGTSRQFANMKMKEQNLENETSQRKR
jgi:hypothetical protein